MAVKRLGQVLLAGIILAYVVFAVSQCIGRERCLDELGPLGMGDECLDHP